MKKILCFLIFLSQLTGYVRAQNVSAYNVVWNTQSKNSSASMPLGGGDIGCNVWVENNDLILYLSRTGTFDENNSMLKLGRVRLNLYPNPFKGDVDFHQELKLQEGYIEITAAQTKIKLWVEVFRPIIHVEITSDQKVKAQATFETWRTSDHSLSPNERHQSYSFNSTEPALMPIFTRKDSIKQQLNRLTWYHQDRNDEMVIDKEAIQQHLGSVKDQLWNPLHNLIFGGTIAGKGMVFDRTIDSIYLRTNYRGWIYKSATPVNQQQIDIVLHTSHAASAGIWLNEINAVAKNAAPTPEKWQKNVAWWAQYWNRSYIYINPGKKDDTDQGWQIGRNYQLFRYQLACNAYGEFPTKFNGGLFTFDPHLVKGEYKELATPDFRRWGGGSFTAQNQRLVYWPMLKSGDFDMMSPQFEFYRRSLKNAELRTKVYWGHEGASFTEQVENFGLPAGHIYERLWGNTTLRPRSDSSSMHLLKNEKGEEVKILDYGHLTNVWVTDLYDGEIEFAKMILDYQRFTGADISKYMPFIESSVKFHDQHFQYWSNKLNGHPLDANGKLIMYPGTGLETYKDATNATSTIAGMQSVLTEMLELPKTYGTAKQREYWQAVLKRLPPISFREMEGKKVISPALSWTGVKNVELPMLYPVFPYNIYGVGKPDLQLAIDTWHHGADKKEQYGIVSWHQDAIFAAKLGLTTEAKQLTIQKLSNSTYRFPSFWGPGLDWAPDHNWGGSGMIGLQEMIMQTDGKKIYLMPAWPKDWNAHIKLHAPYSTIVEADVVEGKIQKLKVTPEIRAKDVVVMPVNEGQGL